MTGNVKEKVMGQASENRSRKVMIGSVAALVVLVVGVIAWRAWAGRTPGPDAPPEQVQKFVASDDFNKLSSDEKQKYMDKLFQPGGERERAMRNMAMAHRQKMLDDYFALPEGKQRQAYLDKQIDQQEEIRKMMENPTTQPGQRMMIRRGGADAAAQKEMTETLPAEYQAKAAQFAKDIKDRRAARGLPTDGPGGGGFMIKIGGPK